MEIWRILHGLCSLKTPHDADIAGGAQIAQNWTPYKVTLRGKRRKSF